MSTIRTGWSRRGFLASASGVGAALTLPLRALSSQNLPADITDMSASELSAAIHGKRVRAVEVMKAYLDRIRRYNPVYNAVVSRVPDDELLKRAELADQGARQR